MRVVPVAGGAAVHASRSAVFGALLFVNRKLRGPRGVGAVVPSLIFAVPVKLADVVQYSTRRVLAELQSAASALSQYSMQLETGAGMGCPRNGD